MTRPGLLLIAALGLAACQPQVPDSAAGVGFGDYETYQQQQEAERLAREAQLAGQAGAPDSTGAPTAAEIAAAGIGRSSDDFAGLATAGNGTGSVTAVPLSTDPAPRNTGAVGAPLDATGVASAAPNNPGISDEQSFDAVSGRRSIESDAERLEQQRAARVEIAPEPVPRRPGGGTNIVAYALSTTNVPGQAIYRRVLASDRRAQSACGRYTSPDLAQEAFLEAGGPQRDRRGLDPDGDGFACEWDPRPFRRGVSAPILQDQVEPEQ